MIEQHPQTMKFKHSSWNLLFSAKRDGIEEKVFHDKCDGKENIVFILDGTSTGYIYGGYTSTTWKKKRHYGIANDNVSFLFVIRPIEARQVCHRKPDDHQYEDFSRLDCTITFVDEDGYYCVWIILNWIKFEKNPKNVYCQDGQMFFEYSSSKYVCGGDIFKKLKDFEVFQL